MLTFDAIGAVFSRWIDSVVESALALLGRFSSSSTVRFVEEADGEFVLYVNNDVAGTTRDPIRIIEGHIESEKTAKLAAIPPGSKIEMVLRSDRFIFRPIELPNRAIEFMPGIVRSQIDRLTPWNAADAAFGWSKPIEADAERMVVTIAATALALIRPCIQAFANAGTQSIAVFTTLPHAGAADSDPIKVWEERGKGTKDIRQFKRLIISILAAAGISAGVALGVDAIISVNLSGQQKALARQIYSARAALGIARNSGLTSAATLNQELVQRKHDAPIVVLVVETLSKLLPDNTYLTELHVEGNKMRISGMTRDAASLIGLIEQSGRFTRATFFAPTTRSPSSSVENFHLEAIIQPLGPSS